MTKTDEYVTKRQLHSKCDNFFLNVTKKNRLKFDSTNTCQKITKYMVKTTIRRKKRRTNCKEKNYPNITKKY